MTLPSFITIRGYAIPFNRTVAIDGVGVEMIDRHAFDGMLSKTAPPRVSLLWGSHDESAPIMVKGVELFADDYGLGFCASLPMNRDNANWWRLRAMTSGGQDQCSVGHFQIIERRRETFHGIRCNRIARATIGHISIVSGAAYREFTAAWPMHGPLDQAPARIRNMAARWERGWSEHRAAVVDRAAAAARMAAAIAKSSSSMPRGNSSAGGPTSSNELAMMMLSGRIEKWADLRAEAMRLGPRDRGVIMGHAAFSRLALRGAYHAAVRAKGLAR